MAERSRSEGSGGGSRLRAGVLIGSGLFLILFMGWIWSLLWDQLRHPGVEIGGSTFTGSANDALAVMLLFGTVTLFGAVGLAFGLHMLISGRESGGLKTLLLWLFSILLAVGIAIRYAAG